MAPSVIFEMEYSYLQHFCVLLFFFFRQGTDVSVSPLHLRRLFEGRLLGVCGGY